MPICYCPSFLEFLGLASLESTAAVLDSTNHPESSVRCADDGYLAMA